ncbi:MAG TPA: efflux RND transporter periplasmic adaptor subunit [Planctomycetota bacterium]|nr:efflux RND transporter periplasmic adaptor subunit [Planctomycetota bacterium]
MRCLAILLALASLAAAEDHDHDAPAPAVVALSAEAQARHGVRVAPVETRTLIDTVRAPGRVAWHPDAVAHVGAPASGRVARLHASVGAAVKAGDPLIEIESPELGRAQSEFLQRRAQAVVAAARIVQAKRAHDRAVALHAEEAIAAAEAQRREAEWKAAETEALAAQADEQAAANALTLFGMDAAARETLIATGAVAPRLVLSAPIDGVLIDRHAALGEIIHTDDSDIATVADPARIVVMVDLPEAFAAAVAAADVATVSGASLASAVEATVGTVAPAIDAATRTVQARVDLPAGTRLRPGAFVQVVIHPRAAGEAVAAVPREAVFVMDGLPVVFVPAGDGAFAAREVEVGVPVGDWVPVMKGLRAGEPAVVAGGFILKADLGKSGAKGCCDAH